MDVEWTEKDNSCNTIVEANLGPVFDTNPLPSNPSTEYHRVQVELEESAQGNLRSSLV